MFVGAVRKYKVFVMSLLQSKKLFVKEKRSFFNGFNANSMQNPTVACLVTAGLQELRTLFVIGTYEQFVTLLWNMITNSNVRRT